MAPNYEFNVCTLHRELAEDAPITNLRKMSKVADASRASVTVITRRVDHAAAREAIQSSSHVWVVNFATSGGLFSGERFKKPKKCSF